MFINPFTAFLNNNETSAYKPEDTIPTVKQHHDLGLRFSRRQRRFSHHKMNDKPPEILRNFRKSSLQLRQKTQHGKTLGVSVRQRP